ncbi:MAG: tripartite tricarboxylate transporter TctB family protein [Thermodesulfobacteriota bacterium]
MSTTNKRKEEIIGYLVVLAFSLLILSECLRMQYVTSKLLPLIFGSFIAVLAVIGLVKQVTVKQAAAGIAPDKGETTAEVWRKYARTGVWIVGFLLCIYLFSLIVAIPLFTFSYTRWHGAKWLHSALFAVSVTLVIYVVFILLLQVDMSGGLLFRILRP